MDVDPDQVIDPVTGVVDPVTGVVDPVTEMLEKLEHDALLAAYQEMYAYGFRCDVGSSLVPEHPGLVNLGNALAKIHVLLSADQPQLALIIASKHIQVAHDQDDKLAMSCLLGCIGNSLLNLGRNDRALKAFEYQLHLTLHHGGTQQMLGVSMYKHGSDSLFDGQSGEVF